jgi:hypothetical protein
VLHLAQNKKELTISGSDVDKMNGKEVFRRYYNCNFAADRFMPTMLRKILLIRKLPAELFIQEFLH